MLHYQHPTICLPHFMSFPSPSCSLLQPHLPPYWLFFNTLSTFLPQDLCTCSHCLQHVSAPHPHICRLTSSLSFRSKFRCHLGTGIFPDWKYLNICPYIYITFLQCFCPLYPTLFLWHHYLTWCIFPCLFIDSLPLVEYGPMTTGPQSILFNVIGSMPTNSAWLLVDIE